MRGSCSSSFRSIPSRAAFPQTSPLASLLVSSSRSSSPLLLPRSSLPSFPSFTPTLRSFSTTPSSSYRAASWITRNHLKVVEAQTPSSPSPSSSDSSESGSKWKSLLSGSKPKPVVKTVDSIDALEQAVGKETDEKVVQEKKRAMSTDERLAKQSLHGRNLEDLKVPKELNWRTVQKAESKRKVPIEYKFKTACFKTSPRKLALIGRQLSRRPIGEAILQMQFSVKKASKRLANSIIQGKNHATALGMDPDKLFLQAVWVGKGATLARIDIKGRGRMGIKHHRSARMYFNVVEGKTYMEREHAMHLRVLGIIKSRGVTVHDTSFRRKKVVIERCRKNSWRW